ncbi:hypothetical protein [Streptosporangium saharense]|uniref:hypothetical protein n=1 Tax=Streptosporangium saharense TaxID=1706840 RepID=UPI003412EF68
MPSGRQALLMLVHLHKGGPSPRSRPGFGVGVATAWRHIREVITLLARRFPMSDHTLRVAKRAGHAFIVVDGTLVSIDRMATDPRLLRQTSPAR